MTLRLPVQVHTALADDAKKQDKSLNQVIVDRLNRSLGGVYVSEEEANDGSILQRLAALENHMRKLDPMFGYIEDEENQSTLDIQSSHAKSLLRSGD